MKSIRLFLISVLALCAAQKAYACWDIAFSPGGYYMYRVYQNNDVARFSNAVIYPGSDENCLEWQKLTSDAIPVEHIYNVIYKMSLEDIEKIYYNKKSQYVNRFLDWIVKNDDEILEFLYLAKLNEHVRLKQASPWYYPTENDEIGKTLQWVVEFSLANGTAYLRDRYLLQAMRALFTLKKYQEVVTLWDQEVSKLPEDNLMRQLMEQYVVGANFHVKRSEKDIIYFANVGDVESILYCSDRAGEKLSRIDALSLICQYSPNSPAIRRVLQECVGAWEPTGEMWNSGRDYVGSPFVPSKDFFKLYNLCADMLKNPAVENPAVWYYTYAFMNDLLDQPEQASAALSCAEQYQVDEYLAESIKVMRIYQDAKLSTYDDEYEAKLFAQLQWLDDKIVNNITPDVEMYTAYGDRLISFESFYYWNDMLRRILLAEVCPRMMIAGKTTRALQLANMADNWLMNLVGMQTIFSFDPDEGRWSLNFTELESYRYNRNSWNRYDYRNHFFEYIDALGFDAANEYYNNIHNPQTDFDRFLNARGYADENYMNDILGTKCLRELNYSKAMDYLGKVGYAYAHHMNVYLERNPFYRSMSNVFSSYWSSYYGTSFRYDFASDMCELEERILAEQDSNRKALMIVDYANAIKESFGNSWSLTQYYKGTCFYGQVCKKRDWVYDESTKEAMQLVKELIDKACDIMTDTEMAAKIQYRYDNFRTVATKYPSSEYGRRVRGRCDYWIDYHSESRLN